MMSNRRTVILLNVALVVVTIAVFANTLNNPFVFDDKTAIVNNESIRSWGTVWPPPDLPVVAARPILNLSFAFNYAVDGYRERGYHAVNLAIHICAGLLLFALLRRTLPDTPISLCFVITLFWLIHPLQTECINYVSQRSELLMSLFYLATLYAAARAFDASQSRGWCIVAVIACTLGMLSKEAMVTAPLMVWLWARVFRRDQMSRHTVFLASLAATWLVLATVMMAWPRTQSVGFGHEISAWTYLLNQSVMICHYLRLVVYPHPLLLDYGLPQVLTLSEVWPYCLALIALIILTIYFLKRKPSLGFAGAWFFILLSPTSSFVPIVTEVGAQRRMYLPLIGILGLIAAIPRRMLPGILVIGLMVAAVLGGLSMKRNAQYADAIVLWQSAVQHRPENARAHNNLANLYRDRRDYQQALTHYQLAADLNPKESVVYSNLGKALVKMDQEESTGHRLPKAIAAFEKSLQYDEENSDALNNLGVLMIRHNKYPEAINYMKRAVAVSPDDDVAHYILARLLLAANRRDEAVIYLKKAVEANPANKAAVEALKKLGQMQR